MGPMSQIKSVVVIYNPKSTGGAKEDATAFCAEARAAGLTAKAVPSQYAGHAEVLARQYAERRTPTMVISASGDGGYNEVVNGVLQSKQPHTVVGVLPSGNANDHYNFLHRGNTIRRILKEDIDAIDALKISYDHQVRYAHSYIGLGVTPQIGEQLTKQRPSRLTEKWIVFRGLFQVKPVKIAVNGKVRRYDHLVFSNIGRMSKVIRITERGSVKDGKFEVVGTEAGSAWQLLGHLLHAASVGAPAERLVQRFTFTMLRTGKVQLDGEVITLKKGTTATVTCEHKLLRTIV